MSAAHKAVVVGALIVAIALVPALGIVPTGPTANADRPSSGVSRGAPIALIDIGELFGDENEPDENEPDDNAPQQAQSRDQGSNVPLGVMLAFVLVAVLFVAYVVLRVRRLVLRARAWGRDLWARL